MNQRDKGIVESYKKSKITSLGQAYKTCSGEKVRAWEHCLGVMRDNNGHDMRILGANTYNFSCACMVNDDKELIYFTASGNRTIKLETENE